MSKLLKVVRLQRQLISPFIWHCITLQTDTDRTATESNRTTLSFQTIIIRYIVSQMHENISPKTKLHQVENNTVTAGWHHPQNRKYLSYYNAIRRRPSHGHTQHSAKFQVWMCGSDRQTDRHTESRWHVLCVKIKCDLRRVNEKSIICFQSMTLGRYCHREISRSITSTHLESIRRSLQSIQSHGKICQTIGHVSYIRIYLCYFCFGERW